MPFPVVGTADLKIGERFLIQIKLGGFLSGESHPMTRTRLESVRTKIIRVITRKSMIFLFSVLNVMSLFVQYKGPAADANVLGEMIFGAVAMNYKSVSLKIHIMDEPRR